MSLVEPLTQFDPETLRAQFPALGQEINGKPLVYLDNAATAQVPQRVLDALTRFHTHDRANVHRGIHALSQRASAQFEAARQQVADYHGVDDQEVVFTRGTTEGLNLFAYSWGGAHLKPGDEILITEMEHHSNIVPWQLIAEQTGAVVRAIPVTDRGELDLSDLDSLLTEKTRIVSVVHISNTLGTVNPLETLAERAHAVGALFVVDGAQATPHMPVDLSTLGADVYVYSGHKVFGPTGIGVFWARSEILAEMPPWEGGGGMIDRVTLEKTTYDDPPNRFEAGTPHIAGAIGLGEAIRFMSELDWDAIAAHEAQLLTMATEGLQAIDGVRIVGDAEGKASVISFVMEGAHPHDIGAILDQKGVAVRTGHHCTQPLMAVFGVPATARASFAPYNTTYDVERFLDGMHTVVKLFG